MLRPGEAERGAFAAQRGVGSVGGVLSFSQLPTAETGGAETSVSAAAQRSAGSSGGILSFSLFSAAETRRGSGDKGVRGPNLAPGHCV